MGDYFGARYYDAAIGRWLSGDPLAEKYAAFSTYVYSANNPIRYFDPDGNRLYDSNGNEITFKQAMYLVGKGIKALYSGNQSNAIPGFHAKPEVSDLWDFKSWGIWSYGGTGQAGVITAGKRTIYNKRKTYKSTISTLWISTTSEGYWKQAGIDRKSIGYTKNGKSIISFYILDEGGNLVYELKGTKKELDKFLSNFGRNTSNAQIGYNNTQIHKQQPNQNRQENTKDEELK